MFQREKYVESLAKACHKYFVETCAAREQGRGKSNALDGGRRNMGKGTAAKEGC